MENDIPITIKQAAKLTGLGYNSIWKRLEPRGNIKWWPDPNFPRRKLTTIKAIQEALMGQQKKPTADDWLEGVKSRIRR